MRWGETSNVYRGTEHIFRNVTIPAGATITACTLYVTSPSNQSTGIAAVDFYADMRDNPASTMSYADFDAGTGFSTATINVSDLGNWTTDQIILITALQSLIQEKIDHANWSSGEAIGILSKGNISGSFYREMKKIIDTDDVTDAGLIITWEE